MGLIPRYRQIRGQCMVSRPDGSWEDITDAFSGVEIQCGDTNSVGVSGSDSVARSATFTLRSNRRWQPLWQDTVSQRSDYDMGADTLVIGDSEDSAEKLINLMFNTISRHPGDSLSPRDKASARNTWQGQFAPLLFPGREIVVRTAITVPGVLPLPGDWRTIYHGIMGDSIKDDGTGRITLSTRDLSKRLLDFYIDTSTEYGSEEGTPAETVMQEILDNNLGSSAPQVYCPESPNWLVKPYTVEYVTLWEAIQAIAGQIGWYLGYKYDTVTDSFRLTFLKPPREKNSPDFPTIDWTNDITLEDIEIKDVGIRNVVSVTFRDKQEGSPTKGKRITKTVQDETSIALFGRRPMLIEESDTSLIDTEAEALRFANAALHDLKDLPAEIKLTLPFFPNLELFDLLQVENPRLHTDPIRVAVSSMSHTLRWPDGNGGEATFETVVTGASRVTGGFAVWLEKEARPGAANPITGGELAHLELPTVSYGETPPTSPKAGDYWIDETAGNVLKRWSGTVWETIQDQAITDAYDEASSKIKCFYQAAPPVASEFGDIWVETDNGNRLYRWSGSAWVDVVPDIGSGDIIDGAVTTQKVSSGAISNGSIYTINDTTGAYTNYTADYVDIPNFKVTFTLSEPALVLISMRVSIWITVGATTGQNCKALVRMVTNGTPGRGQAIQSNGSNAIWAPAVLFDAGTFSAGTHTIKGQFKKDDAAIFANCDVYAYSREIVALILKR